MANDRASIERGLRQFLAENFILEDDGAGLAADESLTESGVLDSMGVLELITFIEEQYGFSVPDEDTLPENLDSVTRLVDYVERRLAGVGAA